MFKHYENTNVPSSFFQCMTAIRVRHVATQHQTAPNKIYELRARALRWLACSALRTKDALLAQPGGWLSTRRAGAPGKFLRLNRGYTKEIDFTLCAAKTSRKSPRCVKVPKIFFTGNFMAVLCDKASRTFHPKMVREFICRNLYTALFPKANLP